MPNLTKLALAVSLFLISGSPMASALTSEQGINNVGPAANVVDPDDQGPAFLKSPQRLSPFDNSKGYLSETTPSNGSPTDARGQNVLGPSVRDMQGYGRN